ncbi:hypothetical protein B0T24DRAFT_22143 [Lasiosphaeria ovina]|uniref:Uncharacterized protein n=1 Tax=Lasiosphaeria ovina TaxID=92902 RepID=A0AAE0NJN8_9PEZI|nr:hypothetical protein B0T24DRAFT_22143 [Lasiosphaeria ovina]
MPPIKKLAPGRRFCPRLQIGKLPWLQQLPFVSATTFVCPPSRSRWWSTHTQFKIHRASSFDFNSPLELSQSPPTTVASHSPASNIQTPPRASPSSGLPPLACDHCHIPATDVALLVKHIKVDHPSASGRLFCGNQRCKDVKDERSLERHLRDHHLGLPYICRCGRKDRKDKHRKHLRQSVRPTRLTLSLVANEREEDDGKNMPLGNDDDMTGTDKVLGC